MSVGIYDLNECSSLNYRERLDIYKSCGFNSVGLYLDEGYMSNDENYVDIIGYAREIGLEVNQVHVDYKISNLICDSNSNVYFDYVEEKLRECISLNVSYMVLHASKGEDAPLLTNEGVKRLADLMKKYEGVKTFLCFENVRDNRNLDIIMNSNINNVGMCYDLGHAYCYDDVNKLYEKHKNKIKCTHLHNNYKKDSHNTLFDGEIDCEKIIRKINSNEKIDNCLEVFPPRGVVLDKKKFNDFVKGCYLDYTKCEK